MRTAQSKGQLYLDDQLVGEVTVRGSEGAWGFGEFQPTPAFANFATLFAEWSRLMHSQQTKERLTPAVADDLRRIESALYAYDAKLHLPELNQWRKLAIVTIDRALIDWKESWSPDKADPSTADMNQEQEP